VSDRAAWAKAGEPMAEYKRGESEENGDDQDTDSFFIFCSDFRRNYGGTNGRTLPLDMICLR